MENNFFIFTFNSTHSAMEFEKKLKNNNLKIKLIPVPRQVSSSCGLAGRVKKGELENIKSFCDNHQIKYDNIYEIFSDKPPKKID